MYSKEDQPYLNLISSLPACEWQKKAPKYNHKIVHELCLSQQILYLGLSVHFSQILKLSVLALENFGKSNYNFESRRQIMAARGVYGTVLIGLKSAAHFR